MKEALFSSYKLQGGREEAYVQQVASASICSTTSRAAKFFSLLSSQRTYSVDSKLINQVTSHEFLAQKIIFL